MLTLLTPLLRERVKFFSQRSRGVLEYWEQHVTWRSSRSWQLGQPSRNCGPQKNVGVNTGRYVPDYRITVLSLAALLQ